MKDEILEELAKLAIKKARLQNRLETLEKYEQREQACAKYQFMIVNDKIEKTPIDFTIEYPNGLPVMVDSDHSGSCYWSLIEQKKDAKKRQLIDNVLWAVDRMKWALTNNPQEISFLTSVILTGGKAGGWWKDMPGDEI